MNTKKIYKILVFTLFSVLALFLIKQEITSWIEKKVVDNTIDSKNPDIISKEIKRLNIAIFLSPNRHENYMIRGELYIRLKDYRKALNDFERVHEIIDDEYDIFRLQGMIYDWIECPDSAEIYYKKSLDIIESKMDNNFEDSSNLKLIRKLLYVSCLMQDDFIKPNENNKTELDTSLSKQILGQTKYEVINDRLNNKQQLTQK